VVGLALAAFSGAIEITGANLGILGLVLLWFLLGYALYATLYAISGVLVSRQEDLQSATTPLTVVIVLSFLVVFPALDDPAGNLARVASLIPLSSPLVMPGRVALDEASALEIVASIGLLLGSVAVLVPFGARIYEGAVLRIGRPLKLVEAWRG
jgi:ABC-2 type transport system permease protein